MILKRKIKRKPTKKDSNDEEMLNVWDTLSYNSVA